MPAYHTRISKSADRDLRNLPNDVQKTLKETIRSVAGHRQPSAHPKCVLLNGTSDIYKIRTGEYRAVAILDQPQFKVVAVGHRSSVYENISEIHAMV